MHIIIGASTYRVRSELDAEAFCTVLRAMGQAALWPWLLRRPYVLAMTDVINTFDALRKR